MSHNKKINFKYNFKVYWSFVKRYKLLLFAIIFLVFLIEIRHVIDKFLFKILIDKGTAFNSGILAIEDLINILIIIAGIFILLIASGFVLRWLHIHLLNI